MRDFWNRLLKALGVLTRSKTPLPTKDKRLEQLKNSLAELVKDFPELSGKLIIEGGKYNYNFDDKGTPLLIDLCLPEAGLFIVLGDIYSASKSTAELYDLDHDKLVKNREEAALIVNFFARMKKTEEVNLLYLAWDEPLTYTAVMSKLRAIGVING